MKMSRCNEWRTSTPPSLPPSSLIAKSGMQPLLDSTRLAPGRMEAVALRAADLAEQEHFLRAARRYIYIDGATDGLDDHLRRHAPQAQCDRARFGHPCRPDGAELPDNALREGDIVNDANRVLRVAVVIPTYNRSDLVARTLSALSAQTYPAVRW